MTAHEGSNFQAEMQDARARLEKNTKNDAQAEHMQRLQKQLAEREKAQAMNRDGKDQPMVGMVAPANASGLTSPLADAMQDFQVRQDQKLALEDGIARLLEVLEPAIFERRLFTAEEFQKFVDRVRSARRLLGKDDGPPLTSHPLIKP